MHQLFDMAGITVNFDISTVQALQQGANKFNGLTEAARQPSTPLNTGVLATYECRVCSV